MDAELHGPRWWATVAQDEDATRIQLGGELDYEAHDGLLDVVVRAFDRRSATTLVIDMRDVSFIDSTGLQAAVIAPATKALGLGVSVRVLPSGVVRDKLQLAGLSYLVD